ncbi:MAG: helix-turn-helix domain-containing protein [Bacilli bacterium]|jgi:cytoskeleton protein RodZ|nr:helix-turn-helix domain-containing protein [Bacilli bacterium]
MKEIGEQLRQAREAMGITITEVAEDLKLNEEQLKNIEDANRDELKDILNIKEIVSEYAKYLGLEQEAIEDKFNEFVFTYTSKIPLDEIAKASAEKEKEEQETKKIVSPYTKKKPKRFPLMRVLICIVLILLIMIIYFFLLEVFIN